MKKDKAIEYLKYLHQMEQKYRKNIFTLEVASLIEKVRFKFIASYREE